MIYILAAIIAIVVLGICITRKPYVDEKPGVSGCVGNNEGREHTGDDIIPPTDDKDNEDELER